MVEFDVPARLRRAILQNDVLLVKRIIKNNPAYLENPDFEDGNNTSLHLAAIKGHLDILKLLLWLGHDSCTPDIDRTGYDSAPGISLNIDSSTALHLAAANSHADCVDLLCQVFPHIIDWKDNDGRTALMLAAQSSNPSNVPVHTSTTSHHIMPPQGRSRAVSAASAMASEDIGAITALLSHNASLTATDHLGNTALHHASAWGNLKAVRVLLAAGTPPLSANKANRTPLDYSVTKQAVQYFQAIVSDLEKYNYDHQSEDRSVPLMASIPSLPPPDQHLQQKPPKLNTTTTTSTTERAIGTPPPDEPRSGDSRMLGSPMSSPVRTRNTEPRQILQQYHHQYQHQQSNASPGKTNLTNFGGLRLVIDTESAEYADVSDVPSTARRIEPSPMEESRMVQS